MRVFIFLLSVFLIAQTKDAKSNEDSLTIELVRKEAILLTRKGNIVESIDKVEHAIAQSKLLSLPEYFINKRLRLFLANRYSNIGDFDRAIELASKLELFYKDNNDLTNELYVKNNLGVYNQNIGRYEVAYNYFLEGWQLQKNSNEIIDKLDWLDGLSASCIELNKFSEAEQYLNEAEQLLKVCPPEDKEVLSIYYYVNKANHALAVEKEDKAEEYLKECIRLNEEVGLRKGADAYQLLADLFFKQGKYTQVLEYSQKTQELLGADQDSLVKDPYLLQSFSIQAKTHLVLGNYKEALLNCKKAEKQAGFFQRQYLFNESKFYIGELRRENLEVAVIALHYLYQQTTEPQLLEEALIYADRAKSNLLNERWNNLKTLSINKHQNAVELYHKVTFQLSELEGKVSNDTLINLRNKLDSLNGVLGIKSDIPFLVSDLKNFQAKLNRNEIYLTYMMIDTLVFRFDIQREKIEWNSQVLEEPNRVLDLYSVLKNPESTPQIFFKYSNSLSSLLPSYLLKKSTIKEIHIVPDGILNYLIFDVIPLQEKGESWKTIHYAGLDYNFSYDFSLQSSQLPTKIKTEVQYVGFAPDYSQLKEYPTLKNGQEILAQAHKHFKSSSYLNEKATEKNFQTYSSSADILHFYTHGVSNDSSYDASYLVLQDDKVHVDEILALPLKASLCILTACEVGLGKVFNGEGIAGIAWSFKASGVKNVIQSMWKLNEKSSSQLMSYFFDHLAAGNSSSVALTKAKRQYLENPEISDRLKHPYYWAGIGHYGYGAVLAEKSESLNWIFILMGATFLIIVLTTVMIKLNKW